MAPRPRRALAGGPRGSSRDEPDVRCLHGRRARALAERGDARRPRRTRWQHGLPRHPGPTARSAHTGQEGPAEFPAAPDLDRFPRWARRRRGLQPTCLRHPGGGPRRLGPTEKPIRAETRSPEAATRRPPRTLGGPLQRTELAVHPADRRRLSGVAAGPAPRPRIDGPWKQCCASRP